VGEALYLLRELTRFASGTTSIGKRPDAHADSNKPHRFMSMCNEIWMRFGRRQPVCSGWKKLTPDVTARTMDYHECTFYHGN
jgi:hypothetical protein